MNLLHSIPRHKLALKAYHQMARAGIPDKISRVELIYGDLIDRTPIGSCHAWLLSLFTFRSAARYHAIGEAGGSSNYFFTTARWAADARRMMVGCNRPSLGDCPYGAPGGTVNHRAENGSSITLVRSNLVSKLKPAKANASWSARMIANSPGCNSLMR